MSDRGATAGPDPGSDAHPAPGPASDVVVRKIDDDHFAVFVAGRAVGRTDFRYRPGGVRVFTHTEVSPDFGGQGLASVLIRAALDETRAAGLTVRPICPFVRAFIEHHPDYADLLAEPLDS